MLGGIRAGLFYSRAEVECVQHLHAIGLNQKAGPHGIAKSGCAQ